MAREGQGAGGFRVARNLPSLLAECVRWWGMPKTFCGSFSRRTPDLVTEELVAVLSRKVSFEFKALFDIVHANLKARNCTGGGEEMLRLRSYEKLQNLVGRGMVKKTITSTGKEYKGLASLASILPIVPPVPAE